jgi:ribose-phosphate pyrophosphokinase
MELLLLTDACRRAGARRVTAVVPYFGYARQDRRTRREPLGARVVAGALESAGLDRVVCIDLHSPAIEGCFGIPLEHLSAVPLLGAQIAPVPDDAILVAPDLGAARLVERYAMRLRRPMAIVHKVRSGGRKVSATELVGDVRGRTPILVDDMVSTGATLEAALAMVRRAGASSGAVAVATHGLLVEDAAERLRRAGIPRLIISDSVPGHVTRGGLEVVSLAALLADAIARLRDGRSLADLR